MKRTPQQRERDMVTIAKLYLRGWTQRKIGQEIGVSQVQVHKDLKKIRKEWMESAIRDFDAAKAQELAKIDEMEAEAWDSFERSKGKRQKTVKEKTTGGSDGGRSRVTITEDDSPGDPRFLERVAWCIDKRCKILGIEAPQKIAPTTPDGNEALPGNVLFVMPDNGRDRVEGQDGDGGKARS